MDLRSDLHSEPMAFNESRTCQYIQSDSTTCPHVAQYGKQSGGGATEEEEDVGYQYVCGHHRGKRTQWSEWTVLSKVSATHMTVQDIHQRLFATLQMEIHHLWPLDVLLIEHQPTSCTIAGKKTQTGVLMKTIGTMLYSFFLCQELAQWDNASLFRSSFRMHFVHAADRWFIPLSDLDRPSDMPPVGVIPTTYADRKKASAKWFWHLLTERPPCDQWTTWFATCQRMHRIHDVADALFLTCGYLTKTKKTSSALARRHAKKRKTQPTTISSGTNRVPLE